MVFPKGIRELSDALTATWEDSLAVAPWGGGTRTELGNPLRRLDVVVDMSHLNGVVEHNPSDLTLTVEAGITLGALQRILVEHGQFLALDPPLPDRATIGGTLATGVSGPTKWQYGNPRDLVIGMKVVQADGQVVKSGGRVVKNVSGYDMARLHIGGLGSLGIIAEASFKLTPLPRNETTLVAAFGSGRRCLETGLSIFHSDVTPLALTSFDRCANEQGEVVSLDGDHFLAIRLGGRPLTLQRQVRECLSLCHLGGRRDRRNPGRSNRVESVAARRRFRLGREDVAGDGRSHLNPARQNPRSGHGAGAVRRLGRLASGHHIPPWVRGRH